MARQARHARHPQHAATERSPAPRTHGRHGRAAPPDGTTTGRTVLLTSVAVVGSLFLALPSPSAAPHPVADAQALGVADRWVPAPLLDIPASVQRPTVGQALPASVTPVALLDREIPSLPAAALAAYRAAAGRQPTCGLSWAVLAGIGDIESGQARDHGSADPAWDGVARPPILGPVLDGGAFASIADTDGGVLDGDPVWDRAVGPLQFLPSTWRRYGVDVDHTGRADPENIRDAAAAAAAYLCVAGGDLSSPAGLTTAVYAYNHSTAYVREVLSAALGYGAQATLAAALALLPPDSLGDAVQHGTVGQPPRASAVPTPAFSAVPLPTGQPTAQPVLSPRPRPGSSPTASPVRPTATPTPTGLPGTSPPEASPQATPSAASSPAPLPS